MPSSGMLRRVTLVETDVSGELSASIIRVTRIGEIGTTLTVISNRRKLQRNHMTNVVTSSPILVTLIIEALSSSETLVLISATRRNISEDGIIHSHSSENLKSYICVKIVHNVAKAFLAFVFDTRHQL
jgi:hypothetical protein